MQDFTPDKNYHPEDEYEPLEIIEEQPAVPINEPIKQVEPQPAQVMPPVQPIQNTIPAQPEYQQAQPYVNPPQPAPFYPAYPAPAQHPAQQPAQQPERPSAIQQPTQYTYPPANTPVYPQPYQQCGPVQPIPPQMPAAQPQPYTQEQAPSGQPIPVNPYAQEQVPNGQPIPVNPYAQEQVPNGQPIPANPYAQEQMPNSQPIPVNPYAQEQMPNGQPIPVNPYTQEQVPNGQPIPVNPYTQEQIPNGQPISANPYTQGYYQQAKAPQTYTPKPSTPTGTKAFIIILCALLTMMVVGFIVYVVVSQENKNNVPEPPQNGFSVPDEKEDDGFEMSPFDGFDYNSYGSYTEIEDEITLKADNGETQIRDDDNETSVGKPDENVKNITLNPLPEDKDDEKYDTQSAYTTVSDSVVTVICYKDEITDNDQDIVSQGTGTIISTNGYIITNAHVISNSRAYAVNIVLNNSDKYPAKIIGYDTWTDLAVLKIDADDLRAVTFGDSSLIEIGDDVIAIGSPGGEKFQNSLTKGIVSAVDRELAVNKYVRYIQSDAAINPGNSGGPLCNIYGQVVGITTAKVAAENYENMSFSIPSKTVEEIVGDLMRYGYVKGRTRIGLSGTEVSQQDIMYYNTPAGIVISSIDESGSLANTDIKEGDIITALDGETITSFQDIYDVLANHKPGDKVTIKVQRPTY